MRVALFHNRTRERGSENTVVEATAELLRKAGHEVRVFLADTAPSLRAALGARYSRETEDLVTAFLDGFPVDLGHVHDFFPGLTPAVHAALRRRGVPVVQTLQDFRLGCANGLFFRDDRPCVDCVSRGPWNAVRHGCYRGSRLQTLVWSDFVAHHRRRGTWTERVDLYVAPSELAREKLSAAGVPASKLRVVRSPVRDPGERSPGRYGAVFVGRLSREKGVHLLLEAWRELSDTPLRIVGTGPDEAALRAAAPANVHFFGELPREAVDVALADASFAVVPSCWYETFGMTAAEAMACGTAVVAPTGTAIAELVEHGRTGLLFERGSVAGLTEACRALALDPERAAFMGSEARAVWEETLASDVAVARLHALYEEAGAARPQ